jgi:hypothetical protein
MKIYQKIIEAKREIGKVAKNAKNPHFKNTYADLNALIEAVEPILLEKGLMLLQPIIENKVFSKIIDAESGECVESYIDLPLSVTPQAMGSAITYYRRYTLQSLLSLQAVDDDGQAASQPAPKETLTDERFENALRLIAEGKYTVEKLKAVYNLTPNQLKQL